MLRSFIPVAMSAAVMAAGMAGCSSGGAGSRDTASPEAIAALASIEQNKAQLADLEVRLVHECVRNQGFPVLPPDPVAIEDTHPEDGTLDPQVAAQRGYGIGSQQPAAEDAAQTDVVWESKPESYKRDVRTAMFGGEDDDVTVTIDGVEFGASRSGCFTHVRKELFGTIEGYLEYTWATTNGVNGARSAGVEDGVAELDDKWSDCMRKAGHSLATPDLALDKARAVYETSPRAEALAAERALAVDDVKCREQVNYDRDLLDLREAGAGAYLAAHEAQFIAYAELQAEARARAQAMLARAES